MLQFGGCWQHDDDGDYVNRHNDDDDDDNDVYDDHNNDVFSHSVAPLCP